MTQSPSMKLQTDTPFAAPADVPAHSPTGTWRSPAQSSAPRSPATSTGRWAEVLQLGRRRSAF